jgi:hypothetical protein
MDAARRQRDSSSTNDTHVVAVAGYSRWWLTRFCRLTVDLGLRIAPLAIMGSAVRPGTRQGQAAPRSSKLDP